MKTRGKRDTDVPNYEQDHPGLEKKFISERIGYGVFATQSIENGEFLLQYKGERITTEEAEEREVDYINRQLRHCYQYFYSDRGKTLCIDATHVKKSLGKFVNDEKPQKANCRMKKIIHNEEVILCLFSTKEINIGDEIRYDYGLKNLPWRTDKDGKSTQQEVQDKTEDKLDIECCEQLPSMMVLNTTLHREDDEEIVEGSSNEMLRDVGCSKEDQACEQNNNAKDHSQQEILTTAKDPKEETGDKPDKDGWEQLNNMAMHNTALQREDDEEMVEVSSIEDSGDKISDQACKQNTNAKDHSQQEILTTAKDPKEETGDKPDKDGWEQLNNMAMHNTALQREDDEEMVEVSSIEDSGDKISDQACKQNTNAKDHSQQEILTTAKDPKEETGDKPDKDGWEQLTNMAMHNTALQREDDEEMVEVSSIEDSGDKISDQACKQNTNAKDHSQQEILTTAKDPKEETGDKPDKDGWEQLTNMAMHNTALQREDDEEMVEVSSIEDSGDKISDQACKQNTNAEDHSQQEKLTAAGYTKEETGNKPDKEDREQLPNMAMHNTAPRREDDEEMVEGSPIEECGDWKANKAIEQKPNAEDNSQQNQTLDTRSDLEKELAKIRSILRDTQVFPIMAAEVDCETALLSDIESTHEYEVADDMSDASEHEADSDYHPDPGDSDKNSDLEKDDDTCDLPKDVPGTSGTCYNKVIDAKMDAGYCEDNSSGCEREQLDDEEQEEEEVHVKCAQRKQTEKGSKRVYDKRNACLFCGKLLKVVIGRHYLSQHKDEVAVAQIMALPVGSRERKVKLDLLRNKGNFFHNEEVIQTQTGEIILMRRPSTGAYFDLDDYGPCPQCLGYVSKDDLWRHVRYRCIAKESESKGESKKRSRVRMESDILMKRYNGASDKLKRMVLSSMKRDELFDVLSNDILILEYGNQVLRNQQTRKHIVSQKMRALASVLLELRKSDPNGGQNISDFIKPSKFDMVVEAVEKRCAIVENDNGGNCQYKFPSFAIKSGHDLVWITRIKRSQAIRQGDAKAEEEANRYLQLHQAEWHVKVASAAASTLNVRKCEKVVSLPSASDLKKLSEHTRSQIKSLTSKLMSAKPEFRDYRLLQKMTLARLIVFNKRRPAEMAKLPVASILNRPQWEKCQIDELAHNLNALEKELSKRYQLVKIVGKRGRPVAVIIPPECSESLKLIIDQRESFGIPAGNPYVFARSTSASFLDGGECLSEVITGLDLEAPETIKSTKMRQYAATVSQVLSLGSQEVEWLASHLGHDVAIHKQYYRLQESTVELCKVSKLLLAMDRGKVSNLRGKTLDEISVDDIPVFEDEQIEESVAMHQLEGDHHTDEEGKQSHHDPPVLENTSSVQFSSKGTTER
ncbi:uncharacterized protein [Apostichopus japonicus]|uniref:uncharacterized protein n=1 Tax=Stichopus japonicus TaxID=307972 RepID=UPI003AB496E9